MKLEQSFTVNAPVEQVWAALVDVERVAPCLPGAEITGEAPDGGYEGSFTVKLGPATAAYRGSLKMESLDEANHVATMSAKGTDKRGQGGANASIVSTMRQEGDETVVDVVTDFTITGRLARFGRGGMIEDISRRLMRDFAQCLQSTLAGQPPAAQPVPHAEAPLPGEEPAEAESPGEEPAGAERPAEEPAEAESPGEEPAGAERPAEPVEPLPPAEPVSPAPGLAAEPGPLPGDEDPAPARAGEPDPWGPLSPPAESVASEATPSEPEARTRTGSIPPPGAEPSPPPPQAKPVKGFSLLFSVLWERIKRFFARLLRRGRES
ncbi:MAG TPA: SRPBCC domain-containing protein [Solirubrobacteraceae bacterium]